MLGTLSECVYCTEACICYKDAPIYLIYTEIIYPSQTMESLQMSLATLLNRPETLVLPEQYNKKRGISGSYHRSTVVILNDSSKD